MNELKNLGGFIFSSLIKYLKRLETFGVQKGIPQASDKYNTLNSY